MDLRQRFKNDPTRLTFLQEIINAYDNSLISHKLDEFQNIIPIYDKYSILKIDKLIAQLKSYEQKHYPTICIEMWHKKSHVTIIDDLDDEKVEDTLDKQLQDALEKEDFETCEKLKNQINRLKK